MTKTLQINSLYLKILKQALEDGIITEDENKILASVNQQLKNFKEVYDKAWEDNVITDDERKLLVESKDQIITKLEDVAKADELISEEEETLLKVIEHVINLEINRSINLRKTYTAVVNL
jgi:fructose-1,6-bisphosphatase